MWATENRLLALGWCDLSPKSFARLFDELALTEATRRDQAASLDAGRKQLLKSPQDSRRLTSPGALLTGEFGVKPVEAPEGEQPALRQSNDAAAAAPSADEEAGGDASSTKKASVPAG